jgi:YidC/Oxa1 family membrane protein insertase
MQNESRNTILFFVCAVAILIAYQFLVLEPNAKKRQAELKAKRPEVAQTLDPAGKVAVAPALPASLTRDAAKAATPRATISTDALSGSINLVGGRIDDLLLRKYGQTVDTKSPRVDLLRPEGTANAWFAEFGWLGQNVPGLPGDKTVASVALILASDD